MEERFTIQVGLHWNFDTGFMLSAEIARAVFKTGKTLLGFMVNESGQDGIHAECTLPVSSQLVTTEFDFGFAYGIGFEGKSETVDQKQTFWSLKANTNDSILGEFGIFYCPEGEIETKWMLAYTSSVNSGIMIRLGYFRERSSFNLPITIDNEHSLLTNLAALFLPV